MNDLVKLVIQKVYSFWDFFGGAVVKHLLLMQGTLVLLPGLRRSPCLTATISCATTTEPTHI